MIKIFLTVRNRLAITKKCIYALKKHSGIKHKIYVYNNESNYLLKEHFDYFYKIYKKGYISQVTFTTSDSTFNAFSKASTCNFFGHQHNEDPLKDKYNFLVILDNDIIVTPKWDVKLHEAWSYVAKHKLNHVKIIGQLPGGIKNKIEKHKIGNMNCRVGKLGGSGLWSIRTNFFNDIGFLNLKNLINHNKKHDQSYWRLLEQKTNGKPYILGLQHKLGIHCGKYTGSVCNKLTRIKDKKEQDKAIQFKDAEEGIEKISFEDFYNEIIDDEQLLNDW
jgi:hypothetical protein